MNTKAFKIKVKNEEDSIRIQQKLFKLGFSWKNSVQQVTRNTDKTYIYVFGKIITYGKNELEFMRDPRKQITATQLLTV